MIIVTRIIDYELTPEEWKSGVISKVIEGALQHMNSDTDHISKWSETSRTPKHRNKFDANYNRYYCRVHYELTP